MSSFKKTKAKIGKTSSGSAPTNQELYSRIKSEAKAKFKDDYPSAYASAWIVREYKSRGGKYS
jgi:hypothetical protein